MEDRPSAEREAPSGPQNIIPGSRHQENPAEEKKDSGTYAVPQTITTIPSGVRLVASYDATPGKERREIPPDTVLLAFDMGSVSYRVEGWVTEKGNTLTGDPQESRTRTEKADQENAEKAREQAEGQKKKKKNGWGGYEKYKRKVERSGPVSDYKFIGPSGMDQLKRDIRNKYQEIRDYMTDLYPNSPVIHTVTGFSNSLVARYEIRDSNGRVTFQRTAAFLDEPSLRCDDYTPDQMFALFRYGVFKPDLLEQLGVDAARIRNADDLMKLPDPIRRKLTDSIKVSSIAKIIALSNHPEIIVKIFGPGVRFKDLKFGSMLGFITEAISGDDSAFGVHETDIRAFKTGKEADTRALLEGTVGPCDIKLFGSSRVQTTEGLFFTIRDFAAESLLIQDLRRRGIIPPDMVAFALDTVGKMLGAYDQFDSRPGNNDLRYCLLRNGAVINPNWNKYAFPDANGDPDYGAINESLDRSINEKKRTGKFVFYCDATEGKDVGMLFEKTADGMRAVQPQELMSLAPEDRDEAVLAVAQGLFFGFRHLLEQKLGDRAELIPLIFYGGLGEQGQTAWNRLIRQIFRNADIRRLPMPSGNLAAAYSAIDNLQYKKPELAIETTTIVDTNDPCSEDAREDEYRRWLDFRQNNEYVRHYLPDASAPHPIQARKSD